MTLIKRYFHRLLLFTVFITLLVTPLVHAHPSLEITVATEKTSYYVGEIVQIYANLTSSILGPILDGLVALDVRANNSLFLFRTLQTGTPPTPNQINITEVATFDAAGQPKDSFNIGDSGRILIRVKNIIPPLEGDANGDGRVNIWDKGLLVDAWLSIVGDENFDPRVDFTSATGEPDGKVNVWDKGVIVDNWQRVEHPPIWGLVTMTMYDGENVPIIKSLASFELPTQKSQAWLFDFQIPQIAYTGNAAVYACAFTDMPKDGGTPYCPEKSKAFEITGSTSSSPSEPRSYQATATSGNYYSTFKIPADAKLGTYTAYVASSYDEEQATASTTFEVTPP